MFEHERLSFDWEDRHLRFLERLRAIEGAEVLSATIYRGKRVIKAHHYVGTVRLGKDTFTILPKIDYGEDRILSATRNLLFLLEQAGYIPTFRQDLAPLLRSGRDWFELLTRIFATELLQQWQRGPHRHYQQIEDDINTLRGKWRISDQLRQTATDHKFAVIYDEFTEDNNLSRVFRFVTEQLWMRTRDDVNRRLLGESRQWLDPVTLLPNLNIASASGSLINRLNDRFEPLLNLSRLFLSRQSFELTAGDLQTFAFVFDMNHLFEMFIINFIRRHRTTILPQPLQDCSLHPQAKRYSRHLAVAENGRSVFRLKPDLVFRRESLYPLLLDTKYKKLSAKEVRLGVKQSDFYQMFAYVHRYHSSQVVLLYPQTGKPIRARFMLEGHGAVVTVATINLHRNLDRADQRQALARELNNIFNSEVIDE